MTTQLTLSVSLRDEATFENFVTDNHALIYDLRAMANGQGEHCLFLFGPPGAGKTHLLEAACMAAYAQARQAHFLPLSKRTMAPACLEDLEAADLVAVDDVDAVLGNRDWEEALFHFYNRAKATGCRMVFSARSPLQALPCVLPDLHSRFAWGLIYGLKSPTDEVRRAILQSRAHQRGLKLPEPVVNYLMHRYSRDMAELLLALDKLDRASLMQKHSITLPFVKTILCLV